jgi:hypothetical protein
VQHEPRWRKEVVISVSGKMSDGKVATDKKVYRIKGIPVQQEQER